jgi:hypothetical protein
MNRARRVATIDACGGQKERRREKQLPSPHSSISKRADLPLNQSALTSVEQRAYQRDVFVASTKMRLLFA